MILREGPEILIRSVVRKLEAHRLRWGVRSRSSVSRWTLSKGPGFQQPYNDCCYAYSRYAEIEAKGDGQAYKHVTPLGNYIYLFGLIINKVQRKGVTLFHLSVSLSFTTQT